jgi:hypothetical protein
MAKASSRNKITEQDLLGTVQRNTLAAATASPNVPQESVQPATESEQGTKALIYFRPEDRKLIRDLSAFLAGQGLRVNDSLVIKSVLRAVRPGDELIAAYHEAMKADRRRKKSQAQQ